MASNASRDVLVGVGIKTTGEDALQRLAAEVEQLSKRGGDAAPVYARLAGELKQLAQQAGQLQAFKQFSADVEALTAAQQQAADKAEVLRVALAEQSATTARFKEAQDAAQASVRQAGAALKAQQLALELLNAETSKAAKGELEYEQAAQKLRVAIVQSKDALLGKKQALQESKDDAAAAAKAEGLLATELGRAEKAANSAAAALRAQREAMDAAGAAAADLGADITNVAAAEQNLLDVQQRLVSGVADERTRAMREQAEADRLAAIEARGLAEAQRAGAAAAEAELATIKESEAFLRRYAAEQREAAAALEKTAAANRELAAEEEKALANLLKLNAAAADQVKAAEYARFWADALAEVDAKAAAAAAELKELGKSAAALEKAAAASRELAAEEEKALANLLKLNAAATEQVKAAEYARFWADALAEVDAKAAAAAAELKELQLASERAGNELREAFGQTGVRSIVAIETEINRVNTSLGLLESKFRAGALSARDFERASSSAQVRLAGLKKEIDTIPSLPGTFERMSTGVNNLINRFGALGAAIATVAVAVKPVLDATIELERMNRVLTTVTGSSAEASRQIEFLRVVAQKSGQDFSAVGDSYAKFAASALNSGVPLATVQKVFESTALAAGNLGLTSDQTARILGALGQSASKGVIQMEELRGQLGDALPGALSLMAKGLGLTEQQLNKLVESGNLLARDALPALADALVQLAPKDGGPVTGLIAEFNRLKNVVLEASTIVTGGAFGQAFGAAMAGVSAVVQRVAFGVAMIGEAFTVVGKQIGTVTAAVITRDFKGLEEALAQIEKESNDKLGALASRIGDSGASASAAAPPVATLAEALKATALEAGKVGETQQAAAAGTAAGLDVLPAHLLLVHVIEDLQFLDAEGYVNYAQLHDVTRKIGERALDKAKEVAQQADITVETSLLDAGGERIASIINNEAARWSADLIVIGTHGRSGFSHLLFGSVAEGVVRGATVPVLLVRSD